MALHTVLAAQTNHRSRLGIPRAFFVADVVYIERPAG